MDALLTPTEPTRADTPIRFDAHPWIRRAFLAIVGVGLLWRFVRYFSQFPIWGDEGMLLLNILEREYAGLTQQLRFAQVAPVLFLWLEKTALLLLGPSEWAVHLFPFCAGLIAFGMFWRTCHASFTPAAAGLAVGVLAVSYYPIRHACEVKPYAFDLCFAVLYLWITLERLRSPEQARWLVALIAVTPTAVFASYPSVFVAGAVSLVLLPTMPSASWPQRGLYGVFNIALIASFLIHQGMVGHSQIDAAEAQGTRDFLRDYWKDAFPPEDVWRWPLWLLKVFTGNMLAYPIGANHGGSAITFLLVLLGSFKLWRDGNHSVLALCWLPFGLNLTAAVLKKYPFGDSARITLHLAPFICVLLAHGVVQVLDWIRAPALRSRLHLALHVSVLGIGVAGIVRDVVNPFKTEHDRDVRRLAHDIGTSVAANEPVLLGHQCDEELLAEFLWYLRAQALPLRWQADGVDADVHSYWLVQCSNQEPGLVPIHAGWKISSSEVRFVPPENKVMPPMYCRWTRLVRE